MSRDRQAAGEGRRGAPADTPAAPRHGEARIDGTPPRARCERPASPRRDLLSALAALIALARPSPRPIAYASGGIGGSQHLATALLEDMTGITKNHVPYTGSGPALTDLIGGQVQLLIEPAVSAAPHVRAGPVRALALTGAKRSSAFPGVPTVAETVPGYEAAAWFASRTAGCTT